MQEITASMNMKKAFKLSLTKDNLKNMLTLCYEREVARRGKKMANSATLQSVLETVASIIHDNLENNCENKKFGIILCGKPGNGKTTCLYAIKNLIIFLSKKFLLQKTTSMYSLTAKEIAEAYKTGNQEKIKQLKLEYMLGIDDLGWDPTEIMCFGNIETPLIDILETRYQQRKFTVITTNCTPEEIKNKYGNRMADRFREMMEVIVFNLESYR